MVDIFYELIRFLSVDYIYFQVYVSQNAINSNYLNIDINKLHIYSYFSMFY